MKIKIFFIIYFIQSICIGQENKPTYQSNNELDFSKFLSGVKYAYILVNDDALQNINDYPSGINARAITLLTFYLKEIGFEDPKWGNLSNKPIYPSICELVVVSPAWNINNNIMSDIALHFNSCKGDKFSFKSKNLLNLTKSKNIYLDIHNTFREMYNLKKPDYSRLNKLSLPVNMTLWTEEKIKTHIKNNGAAANEGIYELALNEGDNAKYKLGLIKTDEGYNLIYLNGATNYFDWFPGEIKAKLFYTATANLFKTDWFLSDKTLYTDFYISFTNGSMILIESENTKTTYIKLFPAYNDNITTHRIGSSSGSGFALTSNGLIATNHHVVNGAKSIKVRGINGDFSKAYNAKLVIEDKNNDLALIKIEDLNFTNLGTIPYIINKKTLDVGSSIFVLGYPLRSTMGDEIKLTTGIISSKSGYQGDITTYQITAPVQPGNSGGPLFDTKGNLVGIVNAKHTGAENVSYAIKVSFLYNLFELMDYQPKLQTISKVTGKPLTEQVKLIKKFTYIIEVE